MGMFDEDVSANDLMLTYGPGSLQAQVAGEAKDGMEAVHMTARLRPDIVVMDIHMPLLDGFEATRRIMVETPTPIVIVTATSDARDMALSFNAVKAGALALLQHNSRVNESHYAESGRPANPFHIGG